MVGAPQVFKPVPLTTPEVVASAYLAVCDGDPHHALVRAIGDALADLCEAERRSREQRRLISHGYKGWQRHPRPITLKVDRALASKSHIMS